MVELDNGPPQHVSTCGPSANSILRKYRVNERSTRQSEVDIKDCKPYIDVMHEQIGGSLAESEREITALIEQLNLLSAAIQPSDGAHHRFRSERKGAELKLPMASGAKHSAYLQA
jgi:hypothetical protein